MAAQRKSNGNAGISFSEIDVRSATTHQQIAFSDRFRGQRTRFSTAISSNKPITATTFDAQVCTAQNFEPSSTGLGTFTFRGGRRLRVVGLSAQQDYTQVMYVDLSPRISRGRRLSIPVVNPTSLFSAPSAM